MMLAGFPVLADAVANFADTVGSTGTDALADRLERAQTDDVKFARADPRRAVGAALEC